MAKTLKDLHKWDRNPRKITPQQKRILQKGLEKYGDLSGVVFNAKNGQLVGGNQRVDVMGPDCKIVVTDRLECPDAQSTVAWGYVEHKGTRFQYREVVFDEADHIAAGMLANKAGGEWDWLKVKDLGTEIDTGAFDMELTGFDSFEWENLLAPMPSILQQEPTSKGENYKIAIEFSRDDFGRAKALIESCKNAGFDVGKFLLECLLERKL